MLVGVALLSLSFPPSGTYAFYFINRLNCANMCNTVYIFYNTIFHLKKDTDNRRYITQWFSYWWQNTSNGYKIILKS